MSRERPEPRPPGTINAQREILATAKGSSLLAGGSFFEFAARFGIAFLLAHLLGAEDYGLYVLAISAATLFSGIALLGLDDAMVRYVAVLAARRDEVGLRGTLQIGLGVAGSAGVVMGVALFLGAGPVAEGLFDQPRLTDLLRLMALLVPFLTISNVLAGIGRGFGQMDSVALAENVVMSLVRLGLLAVFAAVGQFHIVVAVLVFGVSDVAASVTLVVLLNRRFPLAGTFTAAARRDTREVGAFALPLWLAGLLRKFRNHIETILLGSLSAAASVGVFTVVANVTMIGHVFLWSTMVAVKPVLARLHDRGDRAELAHVYQTATRWTVTLITPFVLVMVLYPVALLSVFGEAFTVGAGALVILAVAELAGAGTGMCGPMIDMTGHTRIKLANSLLYTALTIAGSALLIPRWGVLGAAISALIAVVAVSALSVAEIWVLERLLPYNATFLKPVAAGLGAAGTGWLLAARWPAGSDLVMAALQASAVLAVYAGLTLLLRPAPEDRLVVRRVLDKAVLLLRRERSLPLDGGSPGSR